MNWKLLAALCLLQIIIANCTIFECDPTIDCVVPGLQVPDPEDCFKYFACLGPGDPSGPFDCPDNQYYDTDLNVCVTSQYPGQCSNNMCIDDPSQGCVDECGDGNYYFVGDSHSCILYHTCSPPAPQSLTFECQPPDIYFDGTQCVSDPDKCCDFCTLYCTANHVVDMRQIVDPCDCNTIYLCLEVGPPTAVRSCPSGEFFDEDLQDCVPGTCSNKCLPGKCGQVVTTDKTDQTPESTTTIIAIETTTIDNIRTSKDTTSTTTSTTTTSTTITTSTTTESNSACDPSSSFCSGLSNGGYPCSDVCERSYYYCSFGNTQVEECIPGQVFNTDPSLPYCIDEDKCPTGTQNPSCDDSFSCLGLDDGNYARCTTCSTSYYTCSNGIRQENNCVAGEVFNTNLYYPYCVAESTCPFTGCSSDLNFCSNKANGYYPRCSYCDPSYIVCSSGTVFYGVCTEPEVFNLDQNNPVCVTPSECSGNNGNICDVDFSCDGQFDGYYPMCDYCVESYYLCTGGVRTVEDCGEGLEYNTDTSYPFCVESGKCPCEIDDC